MANDIQEWQSSQEGQRLSCIREDHTSPDVPPGFSLLCVRAENGAQLRVTTEYTPEGSAQRLHATLLPSEADADVAMPAQLEALSVATSFRYGGADPARARDDLASDLADPRCRGTDCLTTIGIGTFHFQTGERGAWVMTLELDLTER